MRRKTIVTAGEQTAEIQQAIRMVKAALQKTVGKMSPTRAADTLRRWRWRRCSGRVRLALRWEEVVAFPKEAGRRYGAATKRNNLAPASSRDVDVSRHVHPVQG